MKDETLCCRHCDDLGDGGTCSHCEREGRGTVLHGPVTVSELDDPDRPVYLTITKHQADVIHTALEFAKAQMQGWKLASVDGANQLKWGKRIREVRDLIRIVTEG